MFEVLADNPEGLPKTLVLKFVQERVPPSRAEQASPESVLGPWTVGLVKAGWLVKDNGHWSATSKGRAAYGQYPDPEELQGEWNRLYQFSRKKKSY
jgi:hypothetical protein